MESIRDQDQQQKQVIEEIESMPPSRRRRLLQLMGSYYGISFLIAMVALTIFAWLAGEVLEQEFASMNRSILLWVHSSMSPGFTGVALVFTWIGSVVGILVLATPFAIFLAVRRMYIDIITLGIILVGGALLVFFLKEAFHQIRPQVFAPLVVESNFSFPSGHSLISFSFWGYAAAWLVREGKGWWRWGAAFLFIMIAAMVALSRLYLGVHWPTDVLAGMLIATFWVTTCLTGQRWFVRRRSALESRSLPQPTAGK